MTKMHKNGKMYKLMSNADDHIYVGSTCGTLRQRKYKHRMDARIFPDRRMFKHFNAVGWANVRIVLIEKYPCADRDELNAREQYWIDQLKPTLNMRRAVYTKCPHEKRRDRCNQCYGVSMCEHGRVQSDCRPCGGSQVCEHGRRRSSCKSCGGISSVQVQCRCGTVFRRDSTNRHKRSKKHIQWAATHKSWFYAAAASARMMHSDGH